MWCVDMCYYQMECGDCWRNDYKKIQMKNNKKFFSCGLHSHEVETKSINQVDSFSYFN